MNANQIAFALTPLIVLLGVVAVIWYRRRLATNSPPQKHQPHSGQVKNDPAELARSAQQGHISGHH